MKLYCFDVDNTLISDEMDDDYLKGIISEDMLDSLEKQGHKIAIVSPSPYLPKKYRNENYWFKHYPTNDMRYLNIKYAMKFHGIDADNTIYVDDDEVIRDGVSEMLPIKIISPEEFVSEITSTKLI